MVCKKCEKKLGTIACPEPWKEKSRTQTGSEGRKLGENKLISKSGGSKRATKRFNPYTASSCKICKSNVHQEGGKYCQNCAYKRGICAMCGKQVLDTTFYKQSPA